MMTIVDYGLGNIRAFLNVYKRLNIETVTADRADALAGATKLILPGVGHFDHAMELLDRSGMRETLDDLVLQGRVPILGVCVGMQILARCSDEGSSPGLGWIEGCVKCFDSCEGASALPFPHMGWNDVRSVPGNRLFEQLDSDARFYFLHSYFFQCDRAEDVVAATHYGLDFGSAVNSGNIYGVQFHPEKSHHYGTRLLKNFAEL
jgi:imidazole glycerol-phosphate synthase subunit HisH